jgi:hypothetical protein
MRPRWGLNPGHTVRLIVGRNVTLTLSSSSQNFLFKGRRALAHVVGNGRIFLRAARSSTLTQFRHWPRDFRLMGKRFNRRLTHLCSCILNTLNDTSNGITKHSPFQTCFRTIQISPDKRVIRYASHVKYLWFESQFWHSFCVDRVPASLLCSRLHFSVLRLSVFFLFQ